MPVYRLPVFGWARLFRFTVALALSACAAPTPPITATLTPCASSAEPAALDTLTDLPGTLYYREGLQVQALAGAPPSVSTQLDFPRGTYFLDGLSPDGRWWLSAEFPGDGGRPDPLTLHAVGGAVLSHTVVITSPWPDDNWLFADWITDTLLLVHRVDTSLGRAWPYVVGLYDPMAAEWRTDMLVELPDRYVSGAVAVAPDLTRVVYVAGVDGNFNLVLWDLIEHRELWRHTGLRTGTIIQGTRVGHFPLVWSADSAQVAFSDWHNAANQVQGQMFVLDREGQQARGLTTARPGDLLSGLAWSPDGRYLAGVTYLHTDPAHYVVVVYDMETSLGIDLCSQSTENDLEPSPITGRLIWSPDSQHLAYQVGQNVLVSADGSTFENPNDAIVLENIFSGERYKLAEGTNAQLIGWTAAEPRP